MKQKDIALIILVAGISGVASFFISRLVFVTPANRQQQVEVVDSISSSFPLPSSKYFNPKAFDPTQQITIGNNTNPSPFNGSH